MVPGLLETLEDYARIDTLVASALLPQWVRLSRSLPDDKDRRESLLDAADLLLPIGTFAESSGTYVNVAGTWQSFSGVANPVGESRPAWKVLRVLGNLLDAPNFEFTTSEDVLDEFKNQLGDVSPDNNYLGKGKVARLEA